jgi:RpiB/LacA/LacB family sugar-phosphate isomerase
MKLAIASDHAGLELKRHLAAFLAGQKYELKDLGAFTAEPSDYPDFAEAIGNAVRSGAVERGILICGSGVGASVAANKLKGVRAGLCHDSYSARQGVEHDDMNVLVLGSRVIGPALAEDLVQAFLRGKFTGEARHVRRLAKVAALEAHG